MDSIHEGFEYLDNGEDLSFSRNHSGLVNGYSEHKPDFEDPTEIRQNLRAAMKGARQRIANLRLDLEEKWVEVSSHYALIPCNFRSIQFVMSQYLISFIPLL